MAVKLTRKATCDTATGHVLCAVGLLQSSLAGWCRVDWPHLRAGWAGDLWVGVGRHPDPGTGWQGRSGGDTPPPLPQLGRVGVGFDPLQKQ